MPLKRKPCLGRYHATKSEWYDAYRNARVAAANGKQPNPQDDGVSWKAQLVVAYERENINNRFDGNIKARVLMNKLVDEILSECIEE